MAEANRAPDPAVFVLALLWLALQGLALLARAVVIHGAALVLVLAGWEPSRPPAPAIAAQLIPTASPRVEHRPDWRDICAGMLHDFDDLVSCSEGVSGLHQNGDLADWESLTEGRFAAWTDQFGRARKAIAETEPATIPTPPKFDA
jgi:hypothetical protein